MRIFKQILFILVWVIVLGGLGYFTYAVFFKNPPSCYDGIKNGDEEDVDCGNACGRICIENAKPIEVRGTIKVIPVGDSRSTVVVQIYNPNEDYAAKKFRYSLGIGEEKEEGYSFIYAGAIKYLAFPNIGADPAETPLFQTAGYDWVEKADYEEPSVFVQSKETRVRDNGIEVTGRIKNGDTVAFGETEIVALLYDFRNNLIGASVTRASNIEPEETYNFSIQHPMAPGLNVSATQVFVYPSRQ